MHTGLARSTPCEIHLTIKRCGYENIPLFSDFPSTNQIGSDKYTWGSITTNVQHLMFYGSYLQSYRALKIDANLTRPSSVSTLNHTYRGQSMPLSPAVKIHRGIRGDKSEDSSSFTSTWSFVSRLCVSMHTYCMCDCVVLAALQLRFKACVILLMIEYYNCTQRWHLREWWLSTGHFWGGFLQWKQETP